MIRIKRFDEERPNTPLYHFGPLTTLELLVAYNKLGYTDWEHDLYEKLLSSTRQEIMNTSQPELGAGKFAQVVTFVTPYVVWFTRDQFHQFRKHRDVMLIIDQQRLSYNYKLIPSSGDAPVQYKESAEKIEDIVYNVGDYILEIYVRPRAWDNFDFGKDIPEDFFDDDYYDDNEDEAIDLTKREQEYLDSLEQITSDKVMSYCSSNNIAFYVKDF